MVVRQNPFEFYFQIWDYKTNLNAADDISQFKY